jgi:HlyD family secretion protein
MSIPKGSPRRRRIWRRLASAVLGIAVAGVAFWLVRGGAPQRAAGSAVPQDSIEQTPPSVEVTRPHAGGILRTIQQPAIIHAFESVDLYAMVSGYLKSQSVDIGSIVKKGDVLAEINIPRDTKDYEEAVALVARAKAQIKQAEAKVKVAQAQREAAAAAEKVAESELATLKARREYSEKQHARVKALVAQQAVDAKLLDEEMSNLAAAVAAEQTGAAEILSAKAKLIAAGAAIDQAEADLAETRADVGVAEARRDRAKANIDYAKIVAPFDGVVTHRTFHLGALIRSASEGGQLPLLTVKRTDLMRVVVLVPDGDVTLTTVGDHVEVSVDALGGRLFPGILARIARSEDTERMMRVEIDLKNPDNVLCDGMYGKAVINLGQDPHTFTVPAACIVEHNGRAGGTIYTVRDGVAHRTEVILGGDNGTYAEIRSGASTSDLVVIPAGTPLEDGMRVTAVERRTS